MTYHSTKWTVAGTPPAFEPAVAKRFLINSNSTTMGAVDGGLDNSEAQSLPNLLCYVSGAESSAIQTPPGAITRATRRRAAGAIDPKQFMSEVHRGATPLSRAFAKSDLFGFDEGAYGFTAQDRRQFVLKAARARLKALAVAAREEKEEFSAVSEAALLAFLEVNAPTVSPAIFLLESGNLRAVWKGKGGTQVALEFIGEDRAQYVAFGRPSKNEPMVRSVGVTGFEGAMVVAEAHKVKGLLFD